MASMEYDEAAAERLEAVYRGADIVAQREHTLALLSLRRGESVLDIGSGPGFLCTQIGRAVGPSGKVRGIDISPVMIERSERRNPEPWISFERADATDLPEADASYDVVVSTQVAEYVPRVERFCAEAFRVLKPGGRAVILATDWLTVAWHSEDRERMASVLAAFVPHCAHAALPRTLGPHLRRAGLDLQRVSVYPILNTRWDDSSYSCQFIDFIVSYVRGQGTLPDAVLEEWATEQGSLADRDEYYFLSNRVFFEATKPG